MICIITKAKSGGESNLSEAKSLRYLNSAIIKNLSAHTYIIETNSTMLLFGESLKYKLYKTGVVN